MLLLLVSNFFSTLSKGTNSPYGLQYLSVLHKEVTLEARKSDKNNDDWLERCSLISSPSVYLNNEYVQNIPRVWGFFLQSIHVRANVFLKCISTVTVQHGEDKNILLPDSEVYFSALGDKVSGKKKNLLL